MSDWKNLYKKLTATLAPPGSGVFTVSAGKEKREPLHKKLYGKTEGVLEIWQKSLTQLPQEKILVLGIPSDTGGGILRGANWGPLYLREQLLSIQNLPHYLDIGDVRVVPFLLHDKYLNEETIRKVKKSIYQDEKAPYPVSPLSITEDVCKDIYRDFKDIRIFGIGGDHSCSYPLVKTYLMAKANQKKRPALIHFDAHTDLLKERQGFDICFGTWTANVLELLPSPDLCFQIGIRASAHPQEHWEKTFGIKQFWAEEVLADGPDKISRKIIEKLKKAKVDELYISFDLDCLDESFASATGTPAKGGLSPFEAVAIIKNLAKEIPVTGADFMELAPHLNGNNLQTLLSSGAVASTLIGCLN